MRKNNVLQFINYIIVLFLCVAVALLMIFFPKESLTATQSGINLWLNTVLPALFPFFVCAKIMTYLGIPKLIGRLLEPIVRPIFKVPGEASFVYALSITSGYPIGVELISKMRKKNNITKDEGERMLSFCSTSGPLFILGAVGVGMFSNPLLGWSIAISHYAGALVNGLFFRFHGNSTQRHPSNKKSLLTLINEIKKEENHNPSFIIFLGEAILESFKALLLICGYIVIFSIIVQLIEKFSLFYMFSNMDIFSHNIINPELLAACLRGFFEITIGCHSVSLLPNTDFISACMICTGIISWSGFSIHAQALTFISETDLSKGFYLISKVFHSLFSVICAFFIAPLMLKNHLIVQHTFNFSEKIANSSFIYKLLFSTRLVIVVLLLFALTVIISQFHKRKV